MGAAMLALVSYLSWKRSYPKGDPFSRREVGKTFWRASLVLMTPVIIIGGIFSGVLTPTEASVTAVVYVIFLGLVYRMISFHAFYGAVVGTATAVGALMLVVSVSGLDAWVIAREQVPMMLSAGVSEMVTSPTMVMVLILLLVLILGFFMDATPIILMLVPAIMPLVNGFGIDPLHLGVLFCIVCVIGLITPPVGVALYGVAMVSKLPIDRVFWATLPFFVLLLVLIGIMIAVPHIITFLPSVLIDK